MPPLQVVLRGQSHGLPPWLMGQGHRFYCPHVQFPVAVGTTAAERLVMCVLPSLMLLGSLGLQAQPLQLGVQGHRHTTAPLVPSPLCVPVHLPLDVQMCGILHHPGVLGRGNSVELWVF